VFASEVGTPVDPAHLRRTFARIAKRAELEGFPYLMRHTVVSLLLDGGASIDEVADLTGDDRATLYRHYRHKVRAVATALYAWPTSSGADSDGYHVGYHPLSALRAGPGAQLAEQPSCGRGGGI